jgi:hypothetical protein
MKGQKDRSMVDWDWNLDQRLATWKGTTACVCVVKPHGVSDKPLGEAILHTLNLQTSVVSTEDTD